MPKVLSGITSNKEETAFQVKHIQGALGGHKFIYHRTSQSLE